MYLAQVIESRDCGKPFAESMKLTGPAYDSFACMYCLHVYLQHHRQGQGDMGVCADTFDYYAEAGPALKQQIQLEMDQDIKSD